MAVRVEVYEWRSHGDSIYLTCRAAKIIAKCNRPVSMMIQVGELLAVVVEMLDQNVIVFGFDGGPFLILSYALLCLKNQVFYNPPE
ncbi:MAG: hypothetical protein Greene101415_246 [Parcubacteria group bacterium Greene1014_15]|nr:MAG: hypothetical protein Greene101415_246 [Parcubacteria group bacterium Greene1014_15]